MLRQKTVPGSCEQMSVAFSRMVIQFTTLALAVSFSPGRLEHPAAAALVIKIFPVFPLS